VTETGWGEFEASLRVFFKDPKEGPLDLFHLIKLYPAGPPQPAATLKKVWVSLDGSSHITSTKPAYPPRLMRLMRLLCAFD
jgi:hypothetical protein